MILLHHLLVPELLLPLLLHLLFLLLFTLHPLVLQNQLHELPLPLLLQHPQQYLPVLLHPQSRVPEELPLIYHDTLTASYTPAATVIGSTHASISSIAPLVAPSRAPTFPMWHHQVVQVTPSSVASPRLLLRYTRECTITSSLHCAVRTPAANRA